MDTLHDLLRAQGVTMGAPFMGLSFLALSVIPSLKLTDRGYVDVDRFELVELRARADGSCRGAGTRLSSVDELRGLAHEIGGDCRLVAGTKLAILDHRAPVDIERVHPSRRAEHQRGNGVGNACVCEPGQIPERDVGKLAWLERANFVCSPETSSSMDGSHRKRLSR